MICILQKCEENLQHFAGRHSSLKHYSNILTAMNGNYLLEARMHLIPLKIKHTVTYIRGQGALQVTWQTTNRQDFTRCTLRGKQPALMLLVQPSQIINSDLAFFIPLAVPHPAETGVRGGPQVYEPIWYQTRQEGYNWVKPRVIDGDLHFIHPLCLMHRPDKHLT